MIFLTDSKRLLKDDDQKGPCVGCRNSSATLVKTDTLMAKLLVSMLKESPWPIADIRWATIEEWANQIVKRTR